MHGACARFIGDGRDVPATCCATRSLITSAAGYVFLGSLVFESFFGIPGLRAYTIEAIGKQDFAIVRSMVFVVAVLAIVSYIPDRHRLHLGRPARAGLARTDHPARSFC